MSLQITQMKSARELDSAILFIKEIITAGETYALDGDMSEAEIQDYFFHKGNKAFKAVLDGEIVGVYYLRSNQSGGGNHVANAGFMVSNLARGKGVAKQMATHALETAKKLGFKAMQFNFVVSKNIVAVKLWKNLGFDIIGTIPSGFQHPKDGMVDALIMHKFL